MKAANFYIRFRTKIRKFLVNFLKDFRCGPISQIMDLEKILKIQLLDTCDPLEIFFLYLI
jgi:hypothetical protein